MNIYMALFKSLRGKRENLPSSKTDGYAYFCTDDGTFWIDYTDDSGVVQRKQINAKDAETIMGHTVEVDVPADAKFTDTTYSDATTSTSGLMSDSDKTKLDGIEAEANKTIVDSALSSTSTNPVQNKAINTKFNSVQASIDSKVDIVDGKGLSTNDYTTAEKNKLAGIESGANNYSLPVATSDTLGGIKSGTDITIDSSGNVSVNDDSHNHIIANVDGLQTELDSKVDKVDGKGLSTNDLTATLKSNYDTAYTHSQQPHAPADAEANVIVGIQKNGTDLTITNKKVNITVPTKITDLTNDSDFATTTQLDTKVDKVTGKGLSTNDYTTEDKEKLAAIEDGANKTVVDAALSATSTNPVQNKAVNTKFTSIQADIDSRVPNSRTVNGKSLTDDIILSASDVGALPDTTVIPSIDGLATETYVNNKVANLVDSAPGALDTLNELAAALGDDPNFATTVANQIGTKVDKVDGKGLSANDYTDAEKAKLEGIATGAQVNQNAFSNVIVGSITIAADDVTDSLTLAAGDNVTINADAANDKITISAIDTTYNEAGTELGLVKSGGDVTISNGVITVNDDSHNHTISNVDGLQAELDSKVNVETNKGLSTNDLTDVLKENYDTAYIHSQQPHNYAGSSTSGGAATSANKLNTDAGSETQPVYFKNGVPIVTNTLDSVAFDGYVTKGAESGSTIGTSATVEGENNMASSKQSHAEGGYTRAGNLTLYSESTGMFDSYGYEHAEGYSTLAKKCAAHAEGAHTQAIASMAHAEGLSTIASGGKSHAEGHSTTASGANAHAEGHSTTASEENTHAEGNSTTASSQAAHAEGHSTEASGYASHSEGASTIASGSYSHTEGFYTKAASQYQHVQGKYNIEDAADTYAHIVGNGTSDTARSNAHTLDWSGNAWFAGKVTSENANYAEVGQWADGNVNDEDRIGYFVAIDDTTEGRTIVKATSTADVRGVTVDSPAFSGGYSADKADSNGELFKQYDYVAVMGIVPVIDNGTCTVNGRCMPADDGTAIPSTNNLGYQIIERIDSTRVMIALEPGADMTQRIKTDIEELQNGKMDAPFKPAGKSYLTFSSPSSFTLKVNDTTKHWDGTLEYFASDKTWTTWDGTTTLSSVDNDGEHVLYLRGIGNTKITGDNTNYKWVLTGSGIKCVGNIENLLDYATVESGAHPTMANNCYQNMFRDCTSLTQAPALPATTLAGHCYQGMFRNCASLTQAPALPATTLADYCYAEMFNGCTALTQAPALPATTLANSCYSGMFQGCTALTQAPALPATTLASYCYQRMFSGCTGLTQAPALPATTLANYCYMDMFNQCTALIQAPDLPATTLAEGCYAEMFYDCTSLTQAPALPVTTLASSCYYFMFQGCTSLTQAPALPATTLTTNCYSGMFANCTSLTQAPALTATTLAENCYNFMFSGCTSLKLSSTKTGEYTQEYRIPTTGTGTTATDALFVMFASTGGTFTGTPEINTTYYLSSDNMVVYDTEVATLREYVGSIAAPASHASDETIHVTAEEKSAWNAKADAPFKPAGKSYLTFSSPNSFTLAVGDATKHWDGTLEYFASDRTWTVWDGTTTLSSVNNDGEHVLYLRGTGNTVITGDNTGYIWVLTGSDIACIGNIENLLDYSTVESGAHPTMIEYCYSYMFFGCTSLTQAPALPATTLADYCCAAMFSGCTSLIQAPALPATTLASNCYNSMFSGCTSLIQAPALPATTLANGCYQYMFQGCTALTQAPALPATTLAEYCYASMFKGCTGLTKASALPATTLANVCYSDMFRDCTSLTQAPALPAITLANVCYAGMFMGCTGLKLSSTKTGEYTQEYRIPSSGTGTTATNALIVMFDSTGGTFTGTPEINTTYYLSSDNMVVRETEIATLNGYVGSMIDAAIGNAIGGSY